MTVETLSAGGLTVHDGGLPPEVCDSLIFWGESEGFSISPVSESVEEEGRIVERYVVHEEVRKVARLHLDGWPLEVINRRILGWARELVEPALGERVDWWERPQLLKYEAGGHYVHHSDSERCVNPEAPSEEQRYVRVADRDVSLLLYLNDDFRGGDLVFPPMGIRLRPAIGRLVLFPSDHRFSHAALPVEAGTRYAIATWLKRAGAPSIGHAEAHLEIVRPEDVEAVG